MGARLLPPIKSEPLDTPLSAQEMSLLGEEGIELSDLDLIREESDNTLSYKGNRVTVYIRDYGLVREEHSLPVFHVAFCEKVEAMRVKKRLFRYAVTQQEEDQFLMNWIGEHSTQFTQRLTVCQRCLSVLRWENFDLTQMSQEEQFTVLFSFTLNAFFARYPKKCGGK